MAASDRPAWVPAVWMDHPVADWVVLVVVVGAHGLVVGVWGVGDVLAWLPLTGREALYAAGASAAALVAGFSTTAVVYYTSLQGRRGKYLRTQGAAEFRSEWLAVIRAPLLTVFLSLIALALDHTTKDGGGVHWLFEVGFLFGAVRLLRLAALFSAMLEVADADLVGDQKAAAPAVGFQMPHAS